MKKLLKSLPIILVLCIFQSNLYSQIDNVHIGNERISNRLFTVWGGKLYKDQIVTIATEKGLVLIDTGKSPILTKKYRRIIEEEFDRNDFTYVINTHYHFDHTSGNQVFPETKIIANEKTPDLMKKWAGNIQDFVKTRRSNQMIRWNNQIKETEPGTEQWIRLNDYLTTGKIMLDDYENNYVLTLPDITFNDRMTLDLGDVSLKLYYFGEGLHTGDDILILCSEEKVLFSGDLFYKGYFGFAFRPEIEFQRWISVLDEILNHHEIEWVYDCHNGRMTGEYIALYHKYMKDVFISLQEAKAKGLTSDEVMAEYSYEKHFPYIEKSGLEKTTLLKGHSGNLKNTWEYICTEINASK